MRWLILSKELDIAKHDNNLGIGITANKQYAYKIGVGILKEKTDIESVFGDTKSTQTGVKKILTYSGGWQKRTQRALHHATGEYGMDGETEKWVEFVS